METVKKYWPLILFFSIAVILFYQGKRNGFVLKKATIQ